MNFKSDVGPVAWFSVRSKQIIDREINDKIVVHLMQLTFPPVGINQKKCESDTKIRGFYYFLLA
jgi:hypothetical protein